MAYLERAAGKTSFKQIENDLGCEQTPHEMPFDREPLELCAVYAPYTMHFALDI